MLAAERHGAILSRLERDGALRVTELVADLDVSDMTVRRDLEVLAGRGLLVKVHGGAIARGGSAAEPGFGAKAGLQQAQKRAIAAEAVQLVQPGAAVGLSAGSTTRALAELLVDVAGVTVVTNSVQVADAMQPRLRAGQSLILTGGERTPSDALVGPVAVGSLRSLNLDTVFLGVHGMASGQAGFSTPNLLEAETNRALVASGQRLVVLADSSKWGVVGISTMALPGEAHVLVSDEGLPVDARQVLTEEVGELVLAAVEEKV